jgi:hypothetical protein
MTSPPTIIASSNSNPALPTMKMLIFKSFPDLREFRHPALSLHFPSLADQNLSPDTPTTSTAAAGQPESFLCQVTGAHGFFAYNCIPRDFAQTAPQTSPSLVDADGNDLISSSIINSSGVFHGHVPVKSVEVPLHLPRDFPEDQRADVEALKTMLLSTIESTAIENDDPEYNCQTWTELALRGLKEVGFLDERGFELAVEELVEGIWEAEDDEM